MTIFPTREDNNQYKYGSSSMGYWFIQIPMNNCLSARLSVLMLKPGEGDWQTMSERDKALAAREVHSKGFIIPRGYHDDKVNYLDGNISRHIAFCSG